MSERLEKLRQRAALRSLTIKSASAGWELASPYRVVCLGSLDNIAAWLTAAEERDRATSALTALGTSADC